MTNPSFIIGIGGGSASGKTVLAKRLVEAFPVGEARYIAVDFYYRQRDDIPLSERALINYDHPDSLELELCATHLGTLRQNWAVKVPQYDYAVYNRTATVLEVAPAPVIVVEGILTLHEPSVRESLDLKIFVDTPADIRLARRMERDIRERGRTEQSVLTQWQTSVEPMYHLFAENTKAYADLLIDGRESFDPIIDKVLTLVAARR
jgi:uridine kinase